MSAHFHLYLCGRIAVEWLIDMEQTMRSKVYIKTDENNRIIRCEGGYTTPEALTDWTYIDEGTGDKYNLC